jgi:hypothetical protein
MMRSATSAEARSSASSVAGRKSSVGSIRASTAQNAFMCEAKRFVTGRGPVYFVTLTGRHHPRLRS